MSHARLTRRRALMLAGTVLTFLTGAVAIPLAAHGATPGHTKLVRTDPKAGTPNILDGEVDAIVDTGTTIVAGGTFTRVSNAGSTDVLTRNYLLSFDKVTGLVDTAFVPALDGAVEALANGPTAGTVYVGGAFNTVNGVAQKGVVLLNVADGSQVTSFKPPYLNGIVHDLVRSNGHVVIGGTFTKVGNYDRLGLASLSETGSPAGKPDAYLTTSLTGHHNYDGTGANAAVGASAMSLSPDGTRLVVIGNFKNADGVLHDQIVLLTVDPVAGARIANWNTGAFGSACSRNAFDSWVRDVDFGPDGSYFVVVTTGGPWTGTLCDTASRWESGAVGPDQPATWINESGGDTLLSVQATEQAVYVGGHFRWVNNAFGADSARAGAIGRASIAALDARNGLPYSWNPGRNPRGFGVTCLYATPDGLWLGYDTDYLGNFQYLRQRIGMFPTRGGTFKPAEPVGALPGKVYLTGAGGTAPDIRVRSYDGAATVGPTTVLTDPQAVAWQNTRGAFWVANTQYYGLAGNLYARTFDGATFGTSTLVDPYHDNDGIAPDWDTVDTGRGQTYAGVPANFYGTELSSVTGMFYAGGRLYYTMSGQSALYWRWFLPESGAVGARRYTAAASGFGSVSGALFTANGKLYYSWSDGTLYSMDFAAGIPSGAPVALSGPTIDGNDWRARGAFLAP